MGEETSLVQSALDRFNAGDPLALNDLFDLAQKRLEQIAHRMLRDDRIKTLEETGDVVQEASLRLLKALRAEVKVGTPTEVFRLSSTILRRVLIDLARHHYGPEGSAAHRAEAPAAGLGGLDDMLVPAGGSFSGPDALAAWLEFHEKVEKLPEKLREVFDLIWYQELTQKEAANVLNMSVDYVKKHWRDAKRELMVVLKNNFPGLD